jgi:poly(3-hydroxybutyrate) depolymerase
MAEIEILPGTPDDNNREYLPEIIKTTDIVVNENGNNSIVYPKRLQEFKEIVIGGNEDVWYEYVPTSYDPTKKVPLVIGLHGGLMTGWGHAIYTSWTLVAEREGFICLFPNAHEKRMWANYGVFDNFDPKLAPDLPIVVPPKEIKDNHDMNMILALIDKMKEKYNIDEGRIFMQGMSMGNIMTGQFARQYGDILAGAAGSGGPCEMKNIFDRDGKIINHAGHLAIWQSRPEKNGLPPGKDYDEFTINKMNRIYWMRINECEAIPQISIMGEDNFAFYQGKKADMVYVDIKNRDHGQTLDEAFLYWDYLFSGTRRDPDGTIIHHKSKIERTGDKFGVAVAGGFDKAWFQNKVVDLPTKALQWDKLKYHGLNGDQVVRGSYLCVPLSFLAKVFDAEYVTKDDAATVVLTLKDGRRAQFARGSIGCVIDDTVRSMYCEALQRDQELLVSIEWFTKYFYSLPVTSCGGVTYITDHFADLSLFMADLIKDLFKGEMVPDNYNELL